MAADEKKPPASIGPTDIGVPENVSDKVSQEDAGRLGMTIVWGRVAVAIVLAITPIISVIIATTPTIPPPAAVLPTEALARERVRLDELESEHRNIRARLAQLEAWSHPHGRR